MQVIENLLQKMQQTPAFRPMSADTFSDWSIEAGDIISVDADGVVHPFPVFTSELDWAGAAKSTLSCDGSQARQPLRKQERREAAAFGAVSREIAKTDGKILEARNELIAALTGADGAPEDLTAGISNYVRYDLKNNEAFSGSTLFAQIGEKAKSEIRVYTVIGSDGKAHSLADIVADVIQLQGDTEILGNLSIEDGRLKVSKGITSTGAVFASKFYSDDAEMTFPGGKHLTISSDFSVSSAGITFHKGTYAPKPITSTDGTEHTVLGA